MTRGYHHEKNPYLGVDAVVGALPDAARRAQNLRARAAQNGAPLGNPTTGVHELVAALERLKG